MSAKRQFTPEQVLRIRHEARTAPTLGRKPTYRQLGEKWGVSAVSIHNIVNGLIYRNVTEESDQNGQ